MSDLDKLADKYGVSCDMPAAPPEPKHVDLNEFMDLVGPDEFTELSEIGVVGTRFYNQDIAIEPSNKYRPRLVRGKTGNPRLYEEYYRGEPLILDAVQSYTELLVAGTWEIQKPDNMRPEDEEGVQAFVDFYNGKLRNIVGGWDRFIEHAASFLVFGFAIFEIVWGEDEERMQDFPEKLAFREQNTVEDWVMDERGDTLVAVRFNTGGTHPSYYTIPADKLIICNLNARGNNFEGIPPIRPAIHWIKTKRILAQIAAISAEKYGVPVTTIRTDPAYKDFFPGGSDDDRRKDLRDVYAAMRSAEAPVIEMPDGLMAESVAPPGTMPALLEFIQYCDQMITSAFSNEGALLGLQSMVGSYALGEQKERDFLRSAPYYARRIANSLNEHIIKPLAREYLGDMAEYPCLKYRVDGLKDASRWLDDVNKLMPNGAWLRSPQLARAVFSELGIDATDAELESMVAEPVVGTAPEQSFSEKPINMQEVAADVDPESTRGEAATSLRKKLDTIATRHKEEWEKKVGGLTEPEKVQSAAAKLESKYKPMYVKAAVASAQKASVESAREMADKLGGKVATTGGFDQSARLQAETIGEQAFNRVQGFLKEQQVEAVRSTPERASRAIAFTFKQLGSRTMQSIADKAIVAAVHNGRDKVVKSMQESGRTVVAIRRDPSGSDSCGPCKALDGFRTEYGSGEYYEYSPPNKCRGRNGCTCYWEYIVDEGDDNV